MLHDADITDEAGWSVTTYAIAYGNFDVLEKMSKESINWDPYVVDAEGHSYAVIA